MNVHDSDRMEEVLAQHGWIAAPELEEADLVVFNTCSVREKAEQKLRSEVGQARCRSSSAGPELVIAVAGCVAQQEGEKLLERIAHLDLVARPRQPRRAPRPRARAARRGAPASRARCSISTRRASWPPSRACRWPAPVSAFVTTMKGCDERCSFCVVPYTRGPERYRPAEDIVGEVARWVAAGAREVVLLGQTVDSYRDPSLPAPPSDDPDESQFPALLRLIAGRIPRFDPAAPHAPGSRASATRARTPATRPPRSPRRTPSSTSSRATSTSRCSREATACSAG